MVQKAEGQFRKSCRRLIMKTKALIQALLLLVINSCVFAQGEKPAPVAARQTVAFVSVNVHGMDRERVVEEQTVIVRDERISEIGPSAKIKVPEGALRVDGKGRYLMPGLAEMNGHLPPPNQG